MTPKGGHALQGFIKDQSGLGLIARVVKKRISICKLMGILIFDMEDAYFWYVKLQAAYLQYHNRKFVRQLEVEKLQYGLLLGIHYLMPMFFNICQHWRNVIQVREAILN